MSRWSEDLISIERARTLDGLFVQRVHRSPERVAYRYYDRKAAGWCALTWRETAVQVGRWREALAAEGLRRGDRVALLLRNCPEWVFFDLAALSLGLVTVPLYTDDRPENAVYIIEDSAVKVMLVQDAGRWRRIAGVLGERPNPVRVILLDPGGDARRVARDDPRVVLAQDWLPIGGAKIVQRDGDPDELATIVYTSGTTGRPKGVMLSHRNILFDAHASLTIIDCYQEDAFLSFLPLSHMLERTGGYYLPMMAGSVVAYSRSVGQIAEDLQAIRPTAMIAVPRIFERVYTRLHEQIQGRPRSVRALFHLAVRIGWMRFEHGQGRRGWSPLLLLWPLLHKRVAGRVLDKLGGRLRVAVSGGAAMPTEVAHLFIGLGLPIVQGYGLTETSPVVSVNSLQDNRPESVGIPLRGIQVRIGDDDELLVKGPGNMLGYWNNHAATARMVDPAGWLHTGDQARIEQGYIYITGRIKDILVLSNGEKVPPADMEMAIGLDPLVEQVLVVGEGRPFLGALVVLNGDLWVGLAREYGLSPEAPESLDDPRLVKDILKRIRDALRDFPGYAKIRRIALMLEPWSVDNAMLTPTMKIKRKEVLKRHAERIERLYQTDA
ncbi:AMP-forming long-chain acyl-CoA synthetase [Thioflavicoccus mobilis 8321]|uniref:AMP-forming long-chain acyl-CoA synthetase n=1 Tax=Thioflavicoccus mobilis 8321 TaxID=765912 RepID=L0GZI8_9GAMM|nr:AMP-dependent synthetase/ligase [Thioflavicoccus mobilis]AGA90795.1 AMP-forming long-chain acyl-CoA synthetase [Thioflavicoccus mobilis 8321]